MHTTGGNIYFQLVLNNYWLLPRQFVPKFPQPCPVWSCMAQLVEQQWSNPEVMGWEIFLCPRVKQVPELLHVEQQRFLIHHTYSTYSIVFGLIWFLPFIYWKFYLCMIITSFLFLCKLYHFCHKLINCHGLVLWVKTNFRSKWFLPGLLTNFSLSGKYK